MDILTTGTEYLKSPVFSMRVTETVLPDKYNHKNIDDFSLF